MRYRHLRRPSRRRRLTARQERMNKRADQLAFRGSVLANGVSESLKKAWNAEEVQALIDILQGELLPMLKESEALYEKVNHPRRAGSR
jgi:hypothetical protein